MDCIEEIPVPGNKIALKYGGIHMLYEIVRFFFPSRAPHSVHRMRQHVEDVVLCKALNLWPSHAGICWYTECVKHAKR